MSVLYDGLWNIINEKGIDKNHLCDIAGIKKSDFLRIEANLEVSEVALNKLCNVLECEIFEIIKYEDEPEVWDLYNELKEPLGIDHIRGNKIPDGCYHLVVNAWIKNDKNEYLIAQRAASRKSFPLMWECVGGSVLKGEDSLTAAIREVKEEVGIDLENNDGKFLFSKVRKIVDGKPYNDILDVWLFNYNGTVDLELATTAEVKKCRWLNSAEIKCLLDSGKLISDLKYFFTQVDNNE